MIVRARHLQDERLFDCYLAEQGGEPIDPPAAEHLTDCAECARALRRPRGASWTGSARRPTPSSTTIFPPERLRAQQQQIARRIEHLGHRRARHQLPRPSARSADAELGLARDAAVDRARPPPPASFIGIGVGSLYYSPRPAAAQRAVAVGNFADVAPTAPAPRERSPCRRERRQRRVSVGARTRARTAAHPRARRARRAHASRARSSRPAALTCRCLRSIFRKGLDLKHAVAGMLAESYHSDLVDADQGQRLHATAPGRLTVHLAREFGFCYGVDRAVDYAYQTRERFPDRAVYLTGEIIHNPHVNEKLRAMGIRFLSDDARRDRPTRPGRRRHPAGVRRHRRDAAAARAARLHARRHDLRVGAERLEERPALRRRRLHVGHSRQGLARGNAGDRVAGRRVRRALSRRVRRGARPRSSATTFGSGGDRAAFLARFAQRGVAGFDPDRDLQRIGLANQTTMLMSESLEIGEMLKAAMLDRYGEADLGDALPGIRHDLQRHAGSAGRGRRAAARAARSI